MGNTCQLFTGVRDHAPSLQLLKGAPALQNYTIVCDKNGYCPPTDFLRFTFCCEYEGWWRLASSTQLTCILSYTLGNRSPSKTCAHALCQEVPPFNCCLTQYFYKSIESFHISHILSHEASLVTSHQESWNIHVFFFVPLDILLDSHTTPCSLFFLMLCLLKTPSCLSSYFFTLKGNIFPPFLVACPNETPQTHPQRCMKGHLSRLGKNYSRARSHLQDPRHLTWCSALWPEPAKGSEEKSSAVAKLPPKTVRSVPDHSPSLSVRLEPLVTGAALKAWAALRGWGSGWQEGPHFLIK